MSIRIALRLFVFLSCWWFTVQEILELLTSQTNIPDDVLAAVNLTERERELLPEINWVNFSPEFLDLFKRGTVSGIPDGVKCQSIDWCDSVACTEVCKRGTVELEPWFKSAIKTQVALSRQLPLCYAQWLGSHNSGITLSDGYGNRDRYYTRLLKLTRWDRAYVFETHNQWFSLTDQLDMGVRVLELDVHWVKGALRIAHCGGLTNAVLDYIASLVNLVSKLIGRPFRWDVETIGCYPSASSIEAKDQRPLLEAMEEISDWLREEENSDEFLIILLDDQHDLSFWGLLPLLKKQLIEFLPFDWIFTPSDTHLITDDGTLPSADYLLSHNKRIMFISGEYFHDPIMRSFVFYTEDGWLCAWNEPHMDALDLGNCTLPNLDYTKWVPTMSGFISRLQTCEIRYGPLSCTLKLEDTERVLDNELLTKVFGCGYSFPSPDRLTPDRAKSMIWSWTSDAQWSGDNKQTVISSEDGHWRLKDPQLIRDLPIACVNINCTLHYEWELHFPVGEESLCHEDFFPAIPRHGKENSNLQKAMKNSGIIEARIIGAEQYLTT